MIDTTVDQALAEAAQEVLETMFFTTLMDEPCEAGQEPPVRVRIQFHGTPSGTFHLEVDHDAARTIAADFLGKSADELSQAEVFQVICELGNMISGATLSRVEADKQFDLASPEIVAAHMTASSPGSFQTLYLPEGCLRVALKWA